MTERESLFPAVCATCGKEFRDGDIYIEDTSSGFVNAAPDPVVDGLMADLFGGSDNKIRLCENCTERGGKYDVRVFQDA